VEKILRIKYIQFLQITGIIDRIVKSSQVQKYTRLTIFNILVAPTSLYGRETWAMKEEAKSGTTSAEMKFTRRTPETYGKVTKPMQVFYQNLKLTQL